MVKQQSWYAESVRFSLHLKVTYPPFDASYQWVSFGTPLALAMLMPVFPPASFMPCVIGMYVAYASIMPDIMAPILQVAIILPDY